MTRRRYRELHDSPRFPDLWRRGMTDFLSFFATWFFQYDPIFPLIAGLARRSGCRRLRDFCSGGSGYLGALLRHLRRQGFADAVIELTDKYPNRDAFARMEQRGQGGIRAIMTPVDALRPPADGPEIRLMFSAMHHFSPDELKAFLTDARRNRCPVGLFDYAGHDPWRTPPLLLMLTPHVLLLMPFAGRFSWRKMFWTYLVPAIPLALLIDAAISRHNGYAVEELDEIVAQLDADDYEWETGTRLNLFGTGRVVYLTGCPKIGRKD